MTWIIQKHISIIVQGEQIIEDWITERGKLDGVQKGEITLNSNRTWGKTNKSRGVSIDSGNIGKLKCILDSPSVV